MGKLDNKVAIVTGGNAGVGKAIAKLFASEGAKVVISARRKEVLEEVLSSLSLTGFKIEITRVNKSGLDVCDFNVVLDEDNHDHDMNYLYGEHTHHEHHHHHEHRHLHDM